MKDRIHKYVFKNRAGSINDILLSEQHFRPRVTINRSSEAEKLVVNLSVNHTAPFFGSGKGKGKINEMADEIIFFSSSEFAKNNQDLCESFFLITDEQNFSTGQDLHEDIKDYVVDANLNFYCSFKTFNDNEFPEIVEQLKKEEIYPKSLFLSDNYFKTCWECTGEVHINVDGSWKHSPSGEFWHYMCEHGHEWHEFEDRY